MAQQPQTGGFNWGRLSMGSKGLLITGVLMAIALFLPAQSVSGAAGIDFGGLEGFGIEVPDIKWMDRALGTISLILVIGLLVWEGLLAAGVNVSLGATSPALLSAILGWVIAAFGLILFVLSLDGVSWGAFVGLLVSLAMAYAAYIRFQESKLGGTAPPPAA